MIDHDHDTLNLIGLILTSHHYLAVASDSRDSAIQQLDEAQKDGVHFSLIIIGSWVLDIDDFQLCTDIRNRSETQHSPILFLEAHYSSEHATQAIEAGATEYRSKIMTGVESFLSIVHDLIQSSSN